MTATTTITNSTITGEVVKTLWEASAFDCGIYLCRVEALDDNSTAKLSVAVVGRHNHIFHEEVVHPKPLVDGDTDPADIESWKRICDGVIENPDKRSCGIRG